jgi:hypothetical protein
MIGDDDFDDDMPEGLKELIRRMKGMGADVVEIGRFDADDLGDKDRGNMLLPDAQVAALTEAMMIFSSNPKWKPGDLVRYRKSLTPYIKNPEDIHMVFEVLDKPLEVSLPMEDTTTATAVRVLDVIIGTVTKKGAVIRFYSDARELEKHPDAEKLSKPHS